MTIGILILKIVHVAAASTWFGASWLAGTDIRRTLAKGRPHADYLPERITRLEKLAISSGLTTLVTGVSLIAAIHGLSQMPVRLMIVLGLTLATMVVGATLASPAWKRITTAIKQGDNLNEAHRDAVRFERSMQLEHLLRLATLIFVVARPDA